MGYWIAYLSLQNEEYRDGIKAKLYQETTSIEDSAKQMRNFLNSLGKK